MHWAWIDNIRGANHDEVALLPLRCNKAPSASLSLFFFFIVIIIFLNYGFVNKIAVASSLMYWLFGSPYTIYNRANREK